MVATATRIPRVAAGVPKAVESLCETLGFPVPVHIGGGLFSCYGTVTPTAAELILAEHHVENNRPQKDIRFQYSTDIKRNKWDKTGEPIIFNEDMRLCDGQQRLSACVLAGRQFDTVITFGTPAPAMKSIDGGKVRSIRDSATIIGRHIDGTSDSYVRWIAMGTDLSRRTLSRDTIFNLLDVLADSIEFVEQYLPRHVKGVTMAPIKGLVGRAFYSAERSRLEEFCAVLQTGAIGNVQTDAGAAALYRLLTQHRHAGHAGLCVAYRKAMAGLRYYTERKFLKKIYETQEDYFPLPKDIVKKLNLPE